MTKPLLFIITITIIVTDLYLLNIVVRKINPPPAFNNLPTVQPTTPPGYISGSIVAPSNNVPENIQICAEDLETGEKYCTANYQPNPSNQQLWDYRFAVPPSHYSYHVYAFTTDNLQQRAYYSEFVPCELASTCPHTPLPVIVASSQTTSDININLHEWQTI